MKQKTFASMEYEGKKKQTKRELFLNEMERAIPWVALQTVIEPHYSKPALSLSKERAKAADWCIPLQ